MNPSFTNKGSTPQQVKTPFGMRSWTPKPKVVNPTQPAPTQKTGGLLGPQSYRSDLSTGQKYYENLRDTGNPTEQTVAKNWLNRNSGMQNTKTQGGTSGGVITSNNSGFSFGSNPQIDTQKTPTASEFGTPMEAYKHLRDVSGPNALSSGAKIAEATYGMLGNQRQLAPFSGANQSLLQSYANLTRPQSTANLQGETGLFDVQRGILQGAANTLSANALEQQKIEQAGAETGLGAVLPKTITPPESLYNPISGTGAYDPSSGIIRGANYQAFQEASKKYNEMLPTFQAITGIESNLKNILGTSEINPTSINKLNQVTNYLRKNTSDPNYAQFNVFLTSLRSLYSQYLARNGASTDTVREESSKLIPENANANAIVGALSALKSEADTVQNAYHDQLYRNLGGFTSSTIPAPQGGGGSTGGDDFNVSWF